MGRFSFSSLRIRLLPLVLLAVIPALGLILYTGLEQRRQAVVEAQKAAQRLIRLFSVEQERLIEGTHQPLVTLTPLPEVRSGDSAACNTLSAKLGKRYQYYTNLGAIKANGDLFCSGLSFTGRINVAGRASFRRAVETRDFAIGEVQIGRVTKKPTLNERDPALIDA